MNDSIRRTLIFLIEKLKRVLYLRRALDKSLIAAKKELIVSNGSIYIQRSIFVQISLLFAFHVNFVSKQIAMFV